MHSDTNNADSTKADITIEIASTQKTMIQVCLDTIQDIDSSDESIVLIVLLIDIKGLVVRKTCSSKFTLNQ